MLRDRDNSLELLRGIGSLIVLFSHCSAAFPILVFPRPFIDGSAAVTFFFVLSGFVLVKAFARNGDTRYLLKQALKRAPRLGGPVAAVTVVSALIINSGVSAFVLAGNESGSRWLAHYGGVGDIPKPASLGFIVKEAIYGSLIFGHSAYASPLWTITYEFFGSLFVFMYAYMSYKSGKPKTLAAVLALALSASTLGQPFVAMLIGSMIAFRKGSHLAQKTMRFSGLLIAGLILLFYGGRNAELLVPTFFLQNYFAYEQVAGAALILLAFEDAPQWIPTSINSSRLSTMLGLISFPLYLTHVLVIVTFGSSVFLLAEKHLSPAAAQAVAFGATATVSIVLSIPLALLDTEWRRLIDRFARSIIGKN